ncbi:hypothetical protein AB0J38_41095 [Streptomyces sp. NPDC050095]|uniref:hypothetical protein n=1 Tax=unclassified Streptomyces TaxID=2593676 RepID=UPI0034257BED
MRHKNMAAGFVPDELVTFGVLLQWTPGGHEYTVTLVNTKGDPLNGMVFDAKDVKPFEHEESVNRFDMCVYWALKRQEPRVAQIAHMLAGLACFEWAPPWLIPSDLRERLEAVAAGGDAS